MLQWWLKYFRGVGGGGVVEFFLTLTFLGGGLIFFFRGLHINKTYIPRGMSFLSALSIFFGQGGGGGLN